MWESLLGSALTPTLTETALQGAGETLVPAITDEAINTGINSAITGGMSNIGNMAGTTFQPIGAGLVNPTGIFGSWANFGDAIMGDQAKNLFDISGKLYGAYNQGKQLDQAKNIQNQQLAMSQDAYNRDKLADQRRQKLVF